jgi:multidrug efflux pump
LQVDIDRNKANALGVSFDAISATLSSSLGSAYINDFPNAGRLQRVIVQADAQGPHAGTIRSCNCSVLNSSGQSVPLSAFATTRWVTGQMQAVRYNGYPSDAHLAAVRRLASEHRRGDDAEIERLASQLPPGIGIEWTGLSREERLSGSQATILLYVFSHAGRVPVPGCAV